MSKIMVAAGPPIMRIGTLVAAVLSASVLAGCGGAGSPQPTQRPSTISSAASFPCGSPKTSGHQQPVAAVILLDGVGSQENGGTYYPFPVAKPRPSVPVVENFCPLNESHEERAFPDLPSGLDSSLRRWSEFSVPGGSSGGSSAPMVSQACDHTIKFPASPGPSTSAPLTPGGPTPPEPGPAPIPASAPGGFGNGTCLTEALADAGAVLLPYSYTGATLSPDGTFSQKSYTSDDSKQALCTSVTTLASEINSVHSNWPSTAVFLVGHSYGGLVAKTWWYDQQQPGGGQCGIPGGMAGVGHVFSLDSPINGVQRCLLAKLTSGQAASTWCDLWGGDLVHGVPNGLKIAAIDNKELSFTAIGTPNDPTYGLLGGGGLEAQLVYDCFGNYDQNDPAASCIDTTGGSLPVSYPSASPQCDGTSGNIYGTTGHDIVKTCPAVIQMIVRSLQLAPNTTIPRAAEVVTCDDPIWGQQDAQIHCGPQHISARPQSVYLSGDGSLFMQQITWQSWGKATASGTGMLAVDNCQPDCASGKFTNYAAAITASDLVRFSGGQGYDSISVSSPAAVSSYDHTWIDFLPGGSAPSQPTSPSPSPSSQMTPGHGSPEDAVDGFYQGELAGDWAAVCSYVAPSAQTLCQAGTSGQAAATGHVTVGKPVISGNEALVPVTGSICAPSTACVTNSDPSLGMPPSPSQFASYYAKAVADATSSTTVMSPMPCSEIDGKWYVTFGYEP